MNHGKLELVRQELARVNIVISEISELVEARVMLGYPLLP